MVLRRAHGVPCDRSGEGYSFGRFPHAGSFQNPAPILLILCALLVGLLLGVMAPAPEQFGMHGSLVLAGIVNYPPQSPMSAYFLDSWTIIHQFGALLLRAGVHQTYVNKLMFVIPCALLVCGLCDDHLRLQRPLSVEPACCLALLFGQSASSPFRVA